eukprot:Plantae.Rhodophyta-Purpureofilum_apyrenoidigerum.ctg20569.p1 GENE.Plantae.Rhodophyta-Purpureofilum_apyrenoidigerum.ctg20569~~Plantae.Rhodophyta-Purpureofilum_apyrenoidigerum.ctg20569.p1  ORF type:complete len:122 (-),score=8.74 Plantae.Rhodophyta-Purpureofilum_apyrenoidigerum.ctg20569:4-369(-)
MAVPTEDFSSFLLCSLVAVDPLFMTFLSNFSIACFLFCEYIFPAFCSVHNVSSPSLAPNNLSVLSPFTPPPLALLARCRLGNKYSAHPRLRSHLSASWAKITQRLSFSYKSLTFGFQFSEL